MSDRDWSGSVSVLPQSMRELAQEFAAKASETREALKSTERSDVDVALAAFTSYMQDHAYTLNEWANAVEQLYARLDEKGASNSVMTNAQGVALAARFTERTLRMVVTRGSFGLPDDYMYCVAVADRHDVPDFHFGIDPEGRVSS